MFFAYTKILGRIETRTRDRIYCQTIRTVIYISRDDRARIAICSLQTPTDRLKENYSIDMEYLEQYIYYIGKTNHTILQTSSSFSLSTAVSLNG